MGKNLKGKELGKGIGQRKDGLYYARCTDKAGQRLESASKTSKKRETGRRNSSIGKYTQK